MGAARENLGGRAVLVGATRGEQGRVAGKRWEAALPPPVGAPSPLGEGEALLLAAPRVLVDTPVPEAARFRAGLRTRAGVRAVVEP